MTVRLVLNDASLTPPPTPLGDAQLLREILSAFLALRAAVADYDVENVRACTPMNVHGITLPGGSTFGAALKTLEHMDRDAASWLRRILGNGLVFDDNGLMNGLETRAGYVTLDQKEVSALQAAWRHEGIVWSANRQGWREDEIVVEFKNDEGACSTEHLCNQWSSTVSLVHRRKINSRGLTALPEYQDEGQHNPEGKTAEQRNAYTKYRGAKSEIPRNAERLLRRAVPVEGKLCFWAYCEHRFYHRFEGSPQNGWPLVHWNGTTDERAFGNRQPGGGLTEQHVPAAVRERLQRLGPTRDCGCRLGRE